MARNRSLPRGFYDRDTLTVASDLIGKVLVHRTKAGVAAGAIVETEAYIGESDPACHAAPGPTKRNQPLYGPPGVAYVYLNYGMHYLVNAVTEGEGSPAAVLIRALEPLGRTPLFLGTTGTVGVYAFVQSLPGGRDPLSFRPLTADGWTFALTLAVLCGSLAAFPLAPGRGLDALLSAPLTLVAVFFCVDRGRRVQRAYADAVSGG